MTRVALLPKFSVQVFGAEGYLIAVAYGDSTERARIRAEAIALDECIGSMDGDAQVVKAGDGSLEVRACTCLGQGKCSRCHERVVSEADAPRAMGGYDQEST